MNNRGGPNEAVYTLTRGAGLVVARAIRLIGRMDEVQRFPNEERQVDHLQEKRIIRHCRRRDGRYESGAPHAEPAAYQRVGRFAAT